MPPGRQPIQTKRFRRPSESGLSLSSRAGGRGTAGLHHLPLVEERDKIEAKAAVEEHERLQTTIFPDLRLGSLHGRLKGEEKDAVMRPLPPRLDILVSTSVVEVGIDVPNATVMLIEGADRFGLAQLHQFRGRVGRGEHESYCALFTDSESPEAWNGWMPWWPPHDGFVLAEKDLELRGPGDFLGTRQSGLPDLRVAQLSDTATLVMAREAARSVFAQDPEAGQLPHPARPGG